MIFYRNSQIPRIFCHHLSRCNVHVNTIIRKLFTFKWKSTVAQYYRLVWPVRNGLIGMHMKLTRGIRIQKWIFLDAMQWYSANEIDVLVIVVYRGGGSQKGSSRITGLSYHKHIVATGVRTQLFLLYFQIGLRPGYSNLKPVSSV